MTIYGTDNQIVGNNITYSTRWGIMSRGGGGNLIQGNRVANSGGSGIVIFDSNNQVLGNRVADSELAGILLFRFATNNLVQDNNVSGSGRSGISARFGSAGNLIQENRVRKSGDYDLYDESAPEPLANTWLDNKYETKNW